eukprot:SAG31_NODE_2417_length_5729_cov_2.939432_5_plen_138_part_01
MQFGTAQGVLGVLSTINNCDADADFLALIGAAGAAAPRKLLIADARPRLNAEMNRLKGGGYEDVAHYVTRRQVVAATMSEGVDRGVSTAGVDAAAVSTTKESTNPASVAPSVELKFYDIENIHKIRDAFDQLCDGVSA